MPPKPLIITCPAKGCVACAEEAMLRKKRRNPAARIKTIFSAISSFFHRNPSREKTAGFETLSHFPENGGDIPTTKITPEPLGIKNNTVGFEAPPQYPKDEGNIPSTESPPLQLKEDKTALSGKPSHNPKDEGAKSTTKKSAPLQLKKDKTALSGKPSHNPKDEGAKSTTKTSAPLQLGKDTAVKVGKPYYNPDDGCDIPKLKSISRLRSSSVPQWLWTRNECSFWLCEVLRDRLNWPDKKAIDKSRELEGCGPALYLATKNWWMQFLGDTAGACVYAMLLAVRHSEGAVPKNICVGHGNRCKDTCYCF